ELLGQRLFTDRVGVAVVGEHTGFVVRGSVRLDRAGSVGDGHRHIGSELITNQGVVTEEIVGMAND
ncbi:MAG: hypothetical protein P8I99_05810, partial [Acidimicrobiales bacterium]|nr:hypothetical protein [Acidimicrobiales bacterium]